MIFHILMKVISQKCLCKGSIVDVNNKNDIEKTTASHEQDEDKELVTYA